MSKKKPKPKTKAWMKYATPIEIKRHTDLIAHLLSIVGPLYIRAWVPSYAARDFELGQYSAWYVGHLQKEYLEDEQLNSYVGECFDDLEGLRQDDANEVFAHFLETKGYIVFNSGPDGYCKLQIRRME